MDYLKAFAVSAAGMSAERARLEASALNLANANALQGANGLRYEPVRAIVVSGNAAVAAGADNEFGAAMQDIAGTEGFAAPLPQVVMEPVAAKPRRVFEPANPFADAKGFVEYPGVDSATEMVTMMSAVRSYEANVAALNMAKTLAQRALQIGGSSS